MIEDCTLPAGVKGMTDGRRIVYLSEALRTEIDRRCTLTHELIHIEQGHVGSQPAAIEHAVRRATALRLVPACLYREGIQWTPHLSELAEYWHVTPGVALDRITAAKNEVTRCV
ncbi:ImmA/IrrE family metallo-endopeptidase [Pseudoglutamicibacter cumminsii]|uniref:ImmA/IrrE family metallo-endopeptidase n=1 Tax=Pseudoglutamicibacter cumminsii TaxID=156979 RepID=UPI00195A42AA|nr:ImmA/IrrE family metallo-endopeptidase [Pseudoglutamicibacter cumminsii]